MLLVLGAALHGDIMMDFITFIMWSTLNSFCSVSTFTRVLCFSLGWILDPFKQKGRSESLKCDKKCFGRQKWSFEVCVSRSLSLHYIYKTFKIKPGSFRTQVSKISSSDFRSTCSLKHGKQTNSQRAATNFYLKICWRNTNCIYEEKNSHSYKI